MLINIVVLIYIFIGESAEYRRYYLSFKTWGQQRMVLYILSPYVLMIRLSFSCALLIGEILKLLLVDRTAL